MIKTLSMIVTLCIYTLLAGCASIDSQIAHDLRLNLMNTKEIGYGTGQGSKIEVLGKLIEREMIYEFINMIKFGEESEISSQEPFDRYVFFMNENKTMTTIRFEGEKIRYHGKEYNMNADTRVYLNKYYQ